MFKNENISSSMNLTFFVLWDLKMILEKGSTNRHIFRSIKKATPCPDEQLKVD